VAHQGTGQHVPVPAAWWEWDRAGDSGLEQFEKGLADATQGAALDLAVVGTAG